jgi:hypothetical protein
MKSTITQDGTRSAKSYPKLMQYENCGMVVLFQSKGEGIVVNAGRNLEWYVGEYSEDFDSHNLVDFDGTVTLSND